MSDQVYDRGISPVTITAGAIALVRGMRVIEDSTGVCAVAAADATVLGHYVTLQDIAIGEQGAAAAIGCGGAVPMVVNSAVVVGETCSAAAGGKVDNTGAVVLGFFKTAASADGRLAVVELA